MPRRSSTDDAPPVPTYRISEVAQRTGISRELIHHYLRQGLLPESPSRARYDQRQIRLLDQIKVLRDDHNLPLDLIRRVFEVFAFDPSRIEALTLYESLGRRMSGLAESGELIASETLSGDTLVDRAGVPAERLSEYVEAGLIAPFTENGQERYSVYDANVVTLCERGLEHGIAFESFRTIASYIRVGFELEYPDFFRVGGGLVGDAEQLFANLFLRREIAGSFVQNVLAAQLLSHVRRSIVLPPQAGGGLDGVVYRPSPPFVKRHRLDALIDEAQEQLVRRPPSPEAWHRVGCMLTHAGRYREAAFCLDESLERWPLDPALQCAHGRALLLLGEHDEGRRLLERAAESDTPAPLVPLSLALARLVELRKEQQPERSIRLAASVLERVDSALDAARSASDRDRLEIGLFGGWMLTTLPPLFESYDRGRAHLEAALGELEAGCLADASPRGLRDRLRINAAYLLFECMGRSQARLTAGLRSNGSTDEPSSEVAPAEATFTRDQLRGLICRLDPASAFAEAAYLAAPPDTMDRTSNEDHAS